MSSPSRSQPVPNPPTTSSDKAVSGYPIRRSPAVLAAGGVFLPADVCHPLWLALRAHIAARRADGAQIRTDIAEALDAMRAAALDHMSATGHPERTSEDIGASSTRGLVTTEALAGRLGVSARHVRRLAAHHGIAAAARGLWHPDDADHLARTHARR